MNYRNLREFLEALEAAGEMKRIPGPVSAHLEISKYTDAESKSPGGGKALFFEKVKDSVFPVTTNIFGSEKRICMALGVRRLDDLADRVRQYMEFSPPTNLRGALGVLPMMFDLTRFPPRSFKGGRPPCQEVVLKGDAVDLSCLPVLHCWPKDAGPFVTLPLVFTKSAKTGKRNVGMYRLQVFDKNSTGMHWHIHKDGSHYYSEYAKAGKRMPVAVAIGADPASIYAATAPMPRGVDEMLLAGFIRKKPVALAPCLTIDMKVPAEAEFVLEGYVDPGEMRREGPFGDHTGYYSLADDYPVFHVTAITHRKEAIYNATLVGRPPMEDCYLAKATERIFLPMLQSVFPEIVDYWFPWEGVFHNIVVVAIDKAYPGHAHKVISGLWGQGQMSFCKAIVVVDADVDPSNPEAVMAALANRLDMSADIILTKGVLDVLDHSAPQANFGHKIGLDLTRRFTGEPPRARRQAAPPPPAHAESLVMNRIPGAAGCRRLEAASAGSDTSALNRMLAIAVEKRPDRGGRFFADAVFFLKELAAFNFALLYDADIDLSDNSLILWKLFNNVDPARDLYFREGRVVIDACRKGPADGHEREWPEALRFENDV